MRALVCESWREWDALEVKDIAPPPLPFTPGTEVAGTVLESAPDVPDPLPPGTRVFAVLDWGAMAEEAVVDAIHCTPIPDGLAQGETWEAAVAFPISYPTAASALMWRGRVQPGDWVLVHGAAGGVGLAGVEVAKALGCRVAARAAAGKHALLHARGAELVLDSALPFRDAVREATGGVACVLDTLGGGVFDESLRCLGDGGTLVTIGYAAGSIPSVAANILLLKNIGVAGLNWGSYVGWSPGDNRDLHARRVRALWDQLVRWWQDGLLRPEVHARFPLGEFRAAMAEVAGRRVGAVLEDDAGR